MIPISVCMICKNEEKHLENSLSRLRKYDWEIVVTDTGSTDRSVEIARKYADKTAVFPWIDDFSAAKNFAIAQASNDLVLILDCDEYLMDIDMDAVLKLAAAHPDDIGCICLRNHTFINEKDTISSCLLNRFFDRRVYHYVGAVHEQTRRIDGRPVPPFYNLPLTVDHHGYNLSEEEAKIKATRYLNILLKELEKEPDSAYLLFQIGQAYFLEDDVHNALEYYARAIGSPTLDFAEEYVLHLLLGYGNCLLDTGREQEALRMKDVESVLSDYSDYYCLMGRIYYANKEPLQAMMSFIKALSCGKSFIEDASHNIPHYNLGYINEMLGDTASAVVQYKLCKDFVLAEERLRELE